MEKISGILKPSTRATWKFDLPEKPQRLTDPREAEGFDRSSLPVQDPKEQVLKESHVFNPQSREQLAEPMKGSKLNAIA